MANIEKDTLDTKSGYDPDLFIKNMIKVMEESQIVLKEMFSRQTKETHLNFSSIFSAGQAYAEMLKNIWTNPDSFLKAQLEFSNAYTMLLANTYDRMQNNNITPIYQPSTKDRRFQDTVWKENIVFDYIKQFYLLSSTWLQNTVKDIQDLDPKTKNKVDFYTRQLIDAFSPSNFILTNPEVLRATIATNGENLVKGLSNLLRDLEKSKHLLKISTTNDKAFEIGKNIATTPGKVIYQNDLLQLIQYEPSTKECYRIPLFIIAPWINKYYILDLGEKNSFVKWLVDKGYTVFITSWVNPDESLKRKSFEDYLKQGALEPLEAIKSATGESEVNIIGYCLGGTLLSCLLSYLNHKSQEKRVKSATFFTTLVDFRDSGDICVFIDEEQLNELETRMDEEGFYDGTEMATVFSLLRANDMIWSFMINNYLLGKEPMPFDLLYWNSDSTRLPAAMHRYYLNNMYLKNLLIKPGGIKLLGVPIDISTIKTPSYILSTREDHISPWKTTYRATEYYKGPIEFVLSASGHIAGVINPPDKQKYNYWVNNKNRKSWPDPETWFNDATQVAGSWWPHWDKWIKPYSGGKVPARKVGQGKLKPIENAPGSYVKVRCD